jgi:acyl transferase domain-containing protein/acyl carrier protein
MAKEAELRDYLRRVTIELAEERKRLHSYRYEPIAIVGMACRYPGDVSSPEDLWQLVSEGRDAISRFPADRGWDVAGIYDPDLSKAGTSYVRDGGFMSGVTEFDAGFFGMGPREALTADPQQRLLLEVTWEALEGAGIAPPVLYGSRTGVFAGAMQSGYGMNLQDVPEELEGYFGTGLSGSVVSGRVAYTLGLEGPAVTVDTACSSSLVAMHLASQALRQDECSLALAGGASVLALPAPYVEFSRQRGLASDGRSKSFAEAADGVGWSEGVGMLVLERLSDAQANDHPVFAVIRGSAVNQDGASNGLTAPNGPSQERVIRQALASARLEPGEVDAVDAHGTGTILGDPIEAGAILATYGQEREEPLMLGSIKSNIGHTQAAAGVASVIKMAMAMREGVLPRTLHVDRPSSKIEWSAGKVELLTQEQPWQEDHPRRAAVSSFGFSGTNAHVILEQAPEPEGDGESSQKGSSSAEVQPLPGPVPFLLSAKGEGALRAHAARLGAHIEANPELESVDLAYSLASTRTAFEHRAVVVAEDREELLSSLSAFARGADAQGAVQGIAGAEQKPVFLFSGHGSQWRGMALELLDSSPSFAGYVGECEEALSPYIDWSLREFLLSEGEEWLDRVDVVQPILFAISVSLARLWQELGVRPAAVVGHSQGEIAAAYVAGGLTLQDAARLSALRSRLIATLTGEGALVSIALGTAELADLDPWLEGIEVAAVNGPSATILSGEREALEGLLAHCQEQDIRARRIVGAVAPSHSVHVESLREQTLEALAPIEPRPGQIPFHSTVTGEEIDTAQLDAEYWYRNMRQTVLFEPVMRSLLAQGHRLFLEVSPHPVFPLSVNETIERAGPDAAAAKILGTLRRGEGGARRFALALGEAHAAGAAVDWGTFFGGSGARRVPLPTYPFQRKRYWLEPTAGASDPGALGQSPAEHPLLGASVSLASGEQRLLTGRLSLATHPWLADHAVTGAALLPGTGFVELALRAGAEVGCETIDELTLHAPLVLPEEGAMQIQVAVAAPDERGRRAVSIYSRPDRVGDGADGAQEEWALHAEGLLSAEAVATPEPIGEWPPPAAEPLEIGPLYESLHGRGVEYGPAFQGITAAWQDGDTIYAEASLADEQTGDARRFGLHPALLDATFHPSLELGLAAAEAGGAGGLMMPFAWRGVSLHTRGATALRMRLEQGEGGTRLTAIDGDGAPVVSVEAVVGRPLDPQRLQGAAGARALHRVDWREVAAGGWSLPRLAVLGERPPAGLEAECHADIAALKTAVEAGATAPEIAVAEVLPEAGAALPEAFHAVSARVLSLIQEWVGEESLASTRLAVLTRKAIAAAAGESPDLASAPVWGLVRAAQAEHPGRFLLIDVDDSEGSQRALPAVLAAGGEEPQVAIREGKALAPRLAPVDGEGDAPRPIPDESTVLITGGTGAIGAQIARHLVSSHGARHLLLVSRSGEAADGAAELKAELEGLGAEVSIAACDVGEREQVERLLESIPAARPLGAVIHSAAVLDDGVLEALDAERLERVLVPKADAAWHLHELTADLDLSQFILFSSATGLVGGAAQANYAAANTFLDALAAHRSALGLPATSLAWGLWGQVSGLAEDLDGSEALRMIEQIRLRLGFAPMSPERALELFDAARSGGGPLLMPAELDRSVLNAQARTGTLPAVLRGVVRAPVSRAQPPGSLSRKLAELPEEEREAAVLDLVRGHAAAAIGHADASEIEPSKAFRDLGFDSLAAVDLRNRLAAATGLRLAPTLVFDHPSAEALAKFLYAEAVGEARAPEAKPRRAARSAEPLAIVGMSCRYPGGVSSPQELWSLVADGGDAIGPFPRDRGWDLERLYDPDPDSAGTSYLREGGFMVDAAEFDPGFFGISPREALAIDPQQRLLLEGSWEALEDAGIDPRSLRGSSTGVFAGVMYQDYGSPDGGLAPGMTTSAVSGRVSYTLGLEGPAITVDTACSSSLVALHLAGRALREGDCDLALAGGATVLATPTMLIFFSRQRGLAADGRCKAFSEGADGTGVSEGVGLVLLERLSDARANGHRVLAVLRGSAVNQDGASNGFTAPNGPSQERVIRQALLDANLQPQDVDAVEAHGTGTALGDPIEAGALLATYGQNREGPLMLGSIKSNIGHTQAAAGVAGVIKTVMAMREGVLPRTLHVDRPSSRVDWGAGKVELLHEERPWQRNGHPRRAAVSSFGASGTNAHVILEEHPAAESEQAKADGDADGGARLLSGPLPLSLSAKSEEALREQAGRLAAQVRSDPQLDPLDVAHSLVATRAQFEHRAVAVGSDRDRLLAALDALATGRRDAAVITGTVREERRPIFVFPGQGSQWAGMGLDLLDSAPAFAAHMQACEEALAPHVDWSLDEILRDRDGGWLDRLDVVQPALFAIMVSLARLWEAAGVRPAAVVGHSQGEIAAAHVAGALSLEDAALIVALRARAMAKIAGKGGMLSVSLPAADLGERLRPFGERISVAAINGPASLALAGEPAALEELRAACEAEGVRVQPIAVDYAAHSAQIDDLREELLEAFAPIAPQSGGVRFHSTVTGEPLDTAELGAEYWFRNLRQTVLFEPVLRALLEAGSRAFLEVSPHPVIAFGAEETIAGVPEAGEAVVLSTLRRDDGGGTRFATALAEAHVKGVPVRWQVLFEGAGAKRVPLPTYPFQRQRYWLEAGAGAGDLGAAGLADPGHPLLGALVESPKGDIAFTGRLSPASQSWLTEHAAIGAVFLPASAFVELALRAGAEVGCETIEGLSLRAPLTLPEEADVQLSLSVSAPGEGGRREIQVHSRPQGDAAGEEAEWALNAEGVLSAERPQAPDPQATWPPAGAEPVAVDSLYEELFDAGFEYGPAFQGLTAAWRDGERVYAEASLVAAQAEEAGRYTIHPALLDSALQGLGLADEPGGGGGGQPLTASVGAGIAFYGKGGSALRVTIEPGEEGASVALHAADGSPIARIGSLSRRAVSAAELGVGQLDTGLLAIRWEPTALGDAAAAPAQLWRCEPDPAAGRAEAARAAVEGALAAVQQLLTADPAEETFLAIVCEGAVAVVDGEDPDPAAAAVWGLVRAAQSEHPGRFTLLDSDGSPESEAALQAAIAAAEPQLALRAGEAFVPALAPADEPEGAGFSLDPQRTVLITGGGNGLVGSLARHLVAGHGARHLLLIGGEDEQHKLASLKAELDELGCAVRTEVCDAADRGQLESLLETVPGDNPLGAVIHAARVLDDGVIGQLDEERLARTMRPKASAAWNLHELTEGLGVSEFVLFSSAACLLNAAGQGNYAAASAFLDALAASRRVHGLPARALAWGWTDAPGEAEEQGEAVRARLGRLGFAPADEARAVELFEAACRREESALVVADIDPPTLRGQARAGVLPRLLHGLVPVPPQRRSEEASFVKQLLSAPESGREALALALIRGHAAEVLGHASAEDIEPDRAFQELGFDSLGAVELRNRLAAATGLTLAPTLVFDYPSSAALAGYLVATITGEGIAGEALEEERIEEEVDEIGADDLAAMSHEEVFALLDEELDETEEAVQ